MGKVKRMPSRKSKTAQKEKLCSYLHRLCTRTCLSGYEFCKKHILEDKDAPYQHCSYIHPTSRKHCENAALKNDQDESLCEQHLEGASTNHVSNPSTKEELEQLMLSLEPYCSNCPNSSGDLQDEKMDDHLKSYSELFSQEIENNFTTDETSKRSYSKIFDDIDIENSSDEEEPLKYAGTYTREEAIRLYRDKLISLQNLYIEEMKYLKYFLNENRRDYLKEINETEKRSHGGLFDSMPKSTNEERDTHLACRSIVQYHRVFGHEAELKLASIKRKLQESGVSIPLSFYPSKASICNYMDSMNGACKNIALPLTKYCQNHILFDDKQLLFQQCPGSNGNCTKAIVPFIEDTRCLLHSCPEPLRCSPSPVAGPSGLQNLDGINPEQEHFKSIDDIASLGLDVFVPGSLFGLNKFGELDDESTDSCFTYNSRGEPYITSEDYHDTVTISDSS